MNNPVSSIPRYVAFTKLNQAAERAILIPDSSVNHYQENYECLIEDSSDEKATEEERKHLIVAHCRGYIKAKILLKFGIQKISSIVYMIYMEELDVRKCPLVLPKIKNNKETPESYYKRVKPIIREWLAKKHIFYDIN